MKTTTKTKATSKATSKKVAPSKKPMKGTVVNKKSNNRGIGLFVRKAIMEGKEVLKIVEMVKAEFPQAKTTDKCVYYYRSELRKEGKLPEDKKAA